MQVVRFAALIVLMAAPITSPIAAFAGSSPSALRLAQSGPRSAPQREAEPAPAPGASDQEGEGQIAELRSRLKITPAQQPQFDAFAQVMRQNAQEMEKLAAQQPRGKPNAVEAVRAAQKVAQEDAEGLGRLLPKLEALYGTLSEQQKRAADQLFASGPAEEQEPPPNPKHR